MVPRIVLYAAHHCPFAQRSQIALRELGLPFETVLVDITVPRTADYLAINPRGLVPTLVYDGHVLAESGLIVQFPADAHPSHLLKSSSESGGPLQRFKIAFFVDTYFSKAHAFFNRAVYASAEDKIIASNKYIDAVVETIEPLLFDAAPFFGGSTHLTLAEVHIGSFLLRVLALPKHQELFPKYFLKSLKDKAPRFWTWAFEVIAVSTVTAVWDEEDVVNRTIERARRQHAATIVKQ